MKRLSELLRAAVLILGFCLCSDLDGTEQQLSHPEAAKEQSPSALVSDPALKAVLEQIEAKRIPVFRSSERAVKALSAMDRYRLKISSMD